MEMDFGVFYTCYTEFDAVNYSLQKLYSLYPNIPVYLVSDGGSDYKILEESFNGLKTILSFDSRGRVPKITDENYNLEENQKYMFESIMTFLERIKESIDYCKKPYLLIMEPDVLVRGKLTIPSGVSLLGSCVNPYHWAKEKINEILKEIDGSVEVHFYGATPAIIKSDSFIKVYEFFTNNSEYIRRMCKVDSQFANYDITLTVLFAMLGFVEVKNPELIECSRYHGWENTDHPLLHQYRINYPKVGYDGRHK